MKEKEPAILMKARQFKISKYLRLSFCVALQLAISVTLPTMNETFLIHFNYWFQNSCYAKQFPFRVSLSSYASD